MSPDPTAAQPASEEKRPLATPFNLFCGAMLLVGAVLTVMRFTGGLGAVTNLSHDNPWGIWIGFDLLTGVALAAGGYVTASAVYIFGYKRFHAAVRPAVLTGFLGYALVVIALHYDVGQPWRLPYPFLVSPGTTSVLFEVGICVALYLMVLFLEFSPAALEWLGWRRVRNYATRMTMALVIFGVILSTLHQSSLGALFLIAPSKVHPLWYSGYIPLFFFISSIFAGLSMVIFEGTLTRRFMAAEMDEEHMASGDEVALGFGKAAALIMAGYFAIKIFGVTMDDNWHYLATGYGAWFLLEMLVFVLLPCLMFAIGSREKKLALVRWAAFLAVFGVMLNRFNVSIIAFNYHLPPEQRYFPSWGEIGISVFLVVLFLLAFRFIATRMPIFHEHPEYKESH